MYILMIIIFILFVYIQSYVLHIELGPKNTWPLKNIIIHESCFSIYEDIFTSNENTLYFTNQLQHMCMKLDQHIYNKNQNAITKLYQDIFDYFDFLKNTPLNSKRYLYLDTLRLHIKNKLN